MIFEAYSFFSGILESLGTKKHWVQDQGVSLPDSLPIQGLFSLLPSKDEPALQVYSPDKVGYMGGCQNYGPVLGP